MIWVLNNCNVYYKLTLLTLSRMSDQNNKTQWVNRTYSRLPHAVRASLEMEGTVLERPLSDDIIGQLKIAVELFIWSIVVIWNVFLFCFLSGNSYVEHIVPFVKMRWCTAETKWEKNCCDCHLPFEMFGYVECQTACFDWLCCLLADCPSAPSLPRGGHAWKHDELGGLWHPGIVTGGLALLLLLSSYHHIPLLVFLLFCLLPVCLPCRQTYVNTKSTCWDQTCWALRGESPSRPPSTSLGSTPSVPLDFSTEQPHSSCGISDDSVLACSPLSCSRPQEAMLP